MFIEATKCVRNHIRIGKRGDKQSMRKGRHLNEI